MKIECAKCHAAEELAFVNEIVQKEKRFPSYIILLNIIAVVGLILGLF